MESGTFKTKGEAEVFLADKKLLYHKNPEYTKKKPVVFNEVLNSYLAEKKASPEVGVKTYSNYESIIETHIRPKLGKCLITNITPKMANEVRVVLQGHSRSVQQKTSMHLNQIFRKAALENLVNESPTKYLGKLPAAKSIRYNILEPFQIRNLLNVAPNIFYKVYYSLPIYMGLRAGEVAGLGRDCINFDKKEIEIKRTLVWLSEKEMARVGWPTPWLIKDEPKTEAGFRKIPMNKDLAKDLQIFLLEQPENPFNLLFANVKLVTVGDGAGGKYFNTPTPINTNNLNMNQFSDDVKKAEIPDIKYHELRHTFCSLAFASGADLGLVQYWMGHADPEVTLGIYKHVMEEKKRQGSQFAEKLGQMIYPSQPPVSMQPV